MAKGGKLRRPAAGVACAVVFALLAAGPGLADPGKSNGKSNGKSGSPPGQARRGETVSVLGVVQGVSTAGVSVKRLDGTSVIVPVDKNTKVTIDGRSARLTDVTPGSVLSATWKSGKAPSLLRFVRSS
jgi:hypothetical protein